MSNRDLPYFMTWKSQGSEVPDKISEIISNNKFRTDKGQIITDLSSISFHASFGLQNELISKEIKNQIGQNSISFPQYISELQEKTSQELLQLLELDGKIFYTTGGSEAVDNAIKILRQISDRKYILSLNKSYHGALNEALSATGDWRRRGHVTSRYHHFFPDPAEDPFCEKLEKLIKKISPKKVLAIIIETCSAKNGVNRPPQSWFDQIKKLRIKYGFKVILDEVVCGFYRTGKSFGYHHYNFIPDIVCLAKSITGGFIPFGATYFDHDIALKFNDKVLSAGLTNYAHPLGLAATRAIIKLVSTKVFQTRLNKNIKILREFLLEQKYSSPSLKTRQFGMLAGS